MLGKFRVLVASYFCCSYLIQYRELNFSIFFFREKLGHLGGVSLVFSILVLILSFFMLCVLLFFLFLVNYFYCFLNLLLSFYFCSPFINTFASHCNWFFFRFLLYFSHFLLYPTFSTFFKAMDQLDHVNKLYIYSFM